jgi:antitoxin MazE
MRGRGRLRLQLIQPTSFVITWPAHAMDIHLLYRISIGETGMHVAKWENSLAVRLPAAVVEALELKEADEVEIHVARVRQSGAAPTPARAELLKRLRSFRGCLPADFKFDRDEANARQ